ncbi:MAG: hypothetical protein R3B06_26345 [Kofleriaceae bacterium]
MDIKRSGHSFDATRAGQVSRGGASSMTPASLASIDRDRETDHAGVPSHRDLRHRLDAA